MVQGDHPVVRVVVSQADVDQILRRNQGIQVRLAERLQETIPARLARVIPGGADRLPSTVLGSVGGGKVVVDPRDQEGRKTLQKTFQVDIDLPITYNDITVGGRVYVRFDHGHEPLAIQWYRSLRRLFLSRLHV
ncbi:MAG TPA: hypothetical protein VFR01_02905 [Geobacterales bacterium]|nr:hypothetical protein [Geobacterales bacterium]